MYFTGDISRQCSKNGVWLLPLYNCVRPAVTSIQQRVSKHANQFYSNMNRTRSVAVSMLGRMFNRRYKEIFPCVPQKLGFDMSCKLYHMWLVCIKCQILNSG